MGGDLDHGGPGLFASKDEISEPAAAGRAGKVVKRSHQGHASGLGETENALEWGEGADFEIDERGPGQEPGIARGPFGVGDGSASAFVGTADREQEGDRRLNGNGARWIQEKRKRVGTDLYVVRAGCFLKLGQPPPGFLIGHSADEGAWSGRLELLSLDHRGRIGK